MAKTTRRRPPTPLGPLSADELAMLHVFRQLTPEERGHLRWMLETLAAGGAGASHLMGLMTMLTGPGHGPRRRGPTRRPN